MPTSLNQRIIAASASFAIPAYPGTASANSSTLASRGAVIGAIPGSAGPWAGRGGLPDGWPGCPIRLIRFPPELMRHRFRNGEAEAPMQRRLAFAIAGVLLSAGAPVGLMTVRLARQWARRRPLSLRGAIREATADPPDYVYVGTSTALAFAAFGYLLGRQADKLAELSRTDELTGLENARGLFERLDAELARSRRYREPVALLFVDLDGLKDINDLYGHRTGDEAIRSLADVIRSELRESDVGARWGGDEFGVLCPNTASAAAMALAERIRARIPEMNPGWKLSASLGVATFDPKVHSDGVDSAMLMRAADQALYEAKRGGRNRVAMAHDGPGGDTRCRAHA
jgi:diguanylate cyclase (GGDEF)-like protein